jgi:hypothetical protein
MIEERKHLIKELRQCVLHVKGDYNYIIIDGIQNAVQILSVDTYVVNNGVNTIYVNLGMGKEEVKKDEV